MRIAITGATGNVGTALLRRLADESDIEVVGIVRRPPLPGAGALYDAVEWHAADLGEPASVPSVTGWLGGVDAVVHLAWQIQPSHDRERLRRTNVTGTRHVLDSMRQAGVTRLIYASSVGAYAPGPKNRHVNESWPVTGVPRSDYSVDKASVEALLDGAEREDPRLRVARMRQALVFQRDAGAEITRYFLGPLAPVSLLRRRVPVVPSNRRLRVQAVHADDLAEAYLQALRGDAAGPFNIAADPVLDGPMLAAELRGRAVPVPLPVLRALAAGAWWARLQPTAPGWLDLAAAAPLMDCTRAHEELGWRPRRDARQALRELIAGMASGAGTASPSMRVAPGTSRRLIDRLPGHGNPA
ncbi:Nucleoside-diphosphate-sugar epimerase [Micromonospora pattaloongensis]|uniref:Nucleoside-diphosphate-sugar epimerase n=1 Tax=Micromonospora pattaloongensis TaxID=405436 RepID=A0A1H3IDR6_9ACTN|nr:NAD-dependent epimerase/dehydratase family protein [Micromonospora pattaloongensis]SDY25228.1 Nucleoside-diphosphate-sugar epimerase [Micromonospora pattaloongensis]